VLLNHIHAIKMPLPWIFPFTDIVHLRPVQDSSPGFGHCMLKVLWICAPSFCVCGFCCCCCLLIVFFDFSHAIARVACYYYCQNYSCKIIHYPSNRSNVCVKKILTTKLWWTYAIACMLSDGIPYNEISMQFGTMCIQYLVQMPAG